MRVDFILCGCLLFGLSMAAGAAGKPADVHSVASAVDDKYNHLKSLEANFTEIYRGAGIDRTESGVLWLKKPGKMRWEYRSPKEKLFLSDGTFAWFWVPGEQQVQRSKLKDLEDLRSPIAFLLGKTKLEKELRGLSDAPDVAPLDAGNRVLRGVTRGMADRVNQIVLEITPDSWIRRILIDQTDGSTTEYRFSDQRANVEAADRQFEFQGPAGVAVIDGGIGP